MINTIVDEAFDQPPTLSRISFKASREYIRNFYPLLPITTFTFYTSPFFVTFPIHIMHIHMYKRYVIIEKKKNIANANYESE